MIFCNLRSVVGQVHRQSRWIGTHRSFSVESTHNASGKSFPAWFFSRGVALASGVGVGHYMWGGYVSDLVKAQEKKLESTKKKLERRNKVWHALVATTRR